MKRVCAAPLWMNVEAYVCVRMGVCVCLNSPGREVKRLTCRWFKTFLLV